MSDKEKKEPQAKPDSKSGTSEVSSAKLNGKIQSQPNDPATKGQPKNGYGKHGTKPILAADNYAQVVIPDLDEFDPSTINLDGTIVAVGNGVLASRGSSAI